MELPEVRLSSTLQQKQLTHRQHHDAKYARDSEDDDNNSDSSLVSSGSECDTDDEYESWRNGRKAIRRRVTKRATTTTSNNSNNNNNEKALVPKPSEEEMDEYDKNPLLNGDLMKVITDKIHEFELYYAKDIPYWMRNPFIEYGYRLNFSFGLCCKSLFKIHNETTNIWTHMVGFFLFASLAIYTMFFVDLDVKHKTVFLIFLFSAQKCMLFSTLFHLFGCMSPVAFFKLLQLDYAGICALIGGSMLVVIYEGWYCHRQWKWVYLGFATIIVVVGIIACLMKSFYTPSYVGLRTALFVAMAASGIVPTLHLLYHIRFESRELNMIIWPVILQYGVYGIGVAVFAARIPERWFPGKLDLIGVHSHSLMHMFVVTAAFIHYLSSVNYIQHRMHHGCSTWLHTTISLPEHIYEMMVTAKLLLTEEMDAAVAGGKSILHHAMNSTMMSQFMA